MYCLLLLHVFVTKKCQRTSLAKELASDSPKFPHREQLQWRFSTLQRKLTLDQRRSSKTAKQRGFRSPNVEVWWPAKARSSLRRPGHATCLHSDGGCELVGSFHLPKRQRSNSRRDHKTTRCASPRCNFVCRGQHYSYPTLTRCQQS